MRFISKLKKKKFNERINFSKILQLWFNYHFFFFQSLIFRGLKLRAFSLFISIKAGLKLQNFLQIPLSSSNFVNESKEEEDKEVMDDRDYLDTLEIVNINFLNKLSSYDDFVKTTVTLYEVFKQSAMRECSLSYIWFYFQLFFIKKLHKNSFSIVFAKLFFFRKFFFFSDPDFFFLSFLKFSFVIWFYVKKYYMLNFQLKIFKNFTFIKKINKRFVRIIFYFLNYIKFFFIAYITYIKFFFFFFKKNFFFKQIYFFFSEIKWRSLKEEFLIDLGVIRRFKYWHSFYSFFLVHWLYRVNKFQIDSLQQEAFITDKTVFDPSFVFFLALLKLTPLLVLKPLPLGSVNYEMPFPLNYWRRISFASRWIINLLKKKSRVISVPGVVSAIIGTLFDEGFSIEKKHEVYAVVSLNRHLIRHKIMRR